MIDDANKSIHNDNFETRANIVSVGSEYTFVKILFRFIIYFTNKNIKTKKLKYKKINFKK